MTRGKRSYIGRISVQDKRELQASAILPEDSHSAILIGRVWSKAENGPCPVLVKNGHVHDLSGLSATVSGLLERNSLTSELENTDSFPNLGSLNDFLSGESGQLLAPIDLQSIKAAGVTFADSMLERVIEEQAKGDPSRAREIRERLAP